MKLCILDNDVLDPTLAQTYTSFAAMFERLFKAAGANWTYEAFNTVRGEYPESFDRFDAVLLTGSHADSFSQDAWVLTLRERVTELLQAKKTLLGVCFGHQLIGLCLGAKVGRAPQGWGAGRMTYTWHGAEGSPALALLASHQDQVHELPSGATLLVSNDFCPVAGFSVEKHVFCVQPHPEFVEEISAYLLNKRRGILGEVLHARGMASLVHGHDGLEFARRMVAFVEDRTAPCA
jgi:GMP synthase-like glutamine amidotransferase